jgi:uncharacterized membrane protein
MIATAVQFYDVVTFVHVTSIVIGFGPTFAYAAFAIYAQREDGGVGLPAVGKATLFWDRTVNTGAMILILITGLYMTSDGPWSFGDFFVSWGFVAIIVLLGLTHAYFIPKTREQVRLAERDLASPERKLSAEYDALTQRVAKIGTLAGLIIILTIYVMTAKPFL